MLELTLDPDCINFSKGNRISLPLLKNQIDRRILKITSMLMNLPEGNTSYSNKDFSKTSQTQCSQTENNGEIKKDSLTIETTEDSKNQNFMKASFKKEKETAKINEKNKENKSIEKSIEKSLKKVKSNEKIRISDVLSGKKQEPQLPFSQTDNMLQSYKFTFHPEPNERNSGSDADRKLIESSQDQKIFIEMDGLLNLSSIDDFEVYNLQKCISKTAFPEKIGANSHYSISQFSDRSQNIDKAIFGQTHKKSFGNSKVEKNEKQSVEKRLVITQECINRMEEEVKKQISKNRKESADNKLRTNIIKRVADKFGNLEIIA